MASWRPLNRGRSGAWAGLTQFIWDQQELPSRNEAFGRYLTGTANLAGIHPIPYSQHAKAVSALGVVRDRCVYNVGDWPGFQWQFSYIRKGISFSGSRSIICGRVGLLALHSQNGAGIQNRAVKRFGLLSRFGQGLCYSL